MTFNASRSVVRKRSFPVTLTTFLLGFLGVSAAAGSLASCSTSVAASRRSAGLRRFPWSTATSSPAWF